MLNSNNNNKITFLTDPILISRDGLIRIVRRIASLSYTIKMGLSSLKYGGHPGVTRSVIKGMKVLGVEFNYNPNSKFDVKETVVVLSSVKSLKQAIELKKQGLIKKLLAGPNLMDLPTDYEGILKSPEIDVCIVPSKWRQEMFFYFDHSMISKCKVWASGIDEEYWRPCIKPERNSIIVYLKNRNENEKIIIDYLEIIKKAYVNIVVIKYGSFARDFYKKELNKAICMIAFTGGSETQGLVWAEAWAMDVPTFILKHEIDVVRGHEIAASSAPYLDSETGKFFSNKESLENNLNEIKKNNNYQPRKWVLENMTDHVCAEKLLIIIDSIL